MSDEAPVQALATRGSALDVIKTPTDTAHYVAKLVGSELIANNARFTLQQVELLRRDHKPIGLRLLVKSVGTGKTAHIRFLLTEEYKSITGFLQLLAPMGTSKVNNNDKEVLSKGTLLKMLEENADARQFLRIVREDRSKKAEAARLAGRLRRPPSPPQRPKPARPLFEEKKISPPVVMRHADRQVINLVSDDDEEDRPPPQPEEKKISPPVVMPRAQEEDMLISDDDDEDKKEVREEDVETVDPDEEEERRLFLADKDIEALSMACDYLRTPAMCVLAKLYQEREKDIREGNKKANKLRLAKDRREEKQNAAEDADDNYWRKRSLIEPMLWATAHHWDFVEIWGAYLRNEDWLARFRGILNTADRVKSYFESFRGQRLEFKMDDGTFNRGVVERVPVDADGFEYHVRSDDGDTFVFRFTVGTSGATMTKTSRSNGAVLSRLRLMSQMMWHKAAEKRLLEIQSAEYAPYMPVNSFARAMTVFKLAAHQLWCRCEYMKASLWVESSDELWRIICRIYDVYFGEFDSMFKERLTSFGKMVRKYLGDDVDAYIAQQTPTAPQLRPAVRDQVNDEKKWLKLEIESMPKELAEQVKRDPTLFRCMFHYRHA